MSEEEISVTHLTGPAKDGAEAGPLDAKIERAMALENEGKRAEAKALHEEVLAEDPQRRESLSYLAQLAVIEKRYDDAIALVNRYIELAPDEAVQRHSLGLVYEAKGDYPAAIEAYRKGIEIDPQHPLGYLNYGFAMAQTGEGLRAAPAISIAFQLDPTLPYAATSQGVPPVLAGRVKLAQDVLNATMARLHLSALQDTRQRFPNEDLSRVAQAVWPGAQLGRTDYKDPKQKPSIFYMPALKPKATYERGSFRWLPDLEAELAALLADYEAGQDKANFEKAAPYQLGADVNIQGIEGWQAAYLHRNGKSFEDNQAAFPKITEALKNVPLAQLGGAPVLAYLMRLMPGAAIPAHCGQVNSHVTVYLPLAMPEDTVMKVAGKSHKWQPRRAFILDDSFEHSLVNEGDAPVVALVMEVWNPQLSLAERTAIETSFARRKQWFESRAVY